MLVDDPQGGAVEFNGDNLAGVGADTISGTPSVSETVLPRLAVWTVRSFKAMFRPRLTRQPEALAHPDCVLTAA